MREALEARLGQKFQDTIRYPKATAQWFGFTGPLEIPHSVDRGGIPLAEIAIVPGATYQVYGDQKLAQIGRLSAKA